MADELNKIPTSNQSLPHGVINKNAEVTNAFIKLFPALTDEDADSFLQIIGASGFSKLTPEEVIEALPLALQYAKLDLSNIDSKIDYVIDSFSDGTNWWRKYKSGWIEQGGEIDVNYNRTNTTVALPIQFTTTTYKPILTLGGYVTGTDSIYPTYVPASRTTSSFIIVGSYHYAAGGTKPTTWECRGK